MKKRRKVKAAYGRVPRQAKRKKQKKLEQTRWIHYRDGSPPVGVQDGDWP